MGKFKLKKLIKKEKKLWHKHFMPSLIAGLGIAIITLMFEFTASGILIFASVGASAVILANNKSHHLTKLRTAIYSYLTAIFISAILFLLNSIFKLPLAINLFFAIFLISISMYLLDIFHPPVISASAAFIMYNRGILDLFYLILSVIFLLVMIRFISYVFSQHLKVKDFFKEFRKEF